MRLELNERKERTTANLAQSHGDLTPTTGSHFSCLEAKTLARIIFQLGQSKYWKDDLIYLVSSSHISCEELLLPSSLKSTVIFVREVSGRHNVKIK